MNINTYELVLDDSTKHGALRLKEIIPSSIHETLLFPAGSTDDRGELKEMIKEINDAQVPDEEILSYSLYYYDRDKGEVCMCEP